MNINDVYGVMDRFERSSLSRMKLSMDGFELELGKETGAASFGLPEVIAASKSVPASDKLSQEEKVMPSTSIDEKDALKAPLVGTFYVAPGQGEAPFVKVGDHVKKGDVVGIIEAMKLMNEITAPKDGVVEKILVEDATMVEYNQVLMVIA